MAAKGGTGAVDPRDEEPEPPAQAAPAGDADHPASPPPAGDPPARDTEQPDPRRIASQPDFGRELTLARQRAGLTVREVARAVGVPASTTGDYFAGRHLPPPSQPGLLPRILRVCGETNPAELSEWMS
ncbi:MAG: helix-turn-helix domain-containing protein, partial [Streptosporangiaceae bacterium]